MSWSRGRAAVKNGAALMEVRQTTMVSVTPGRMPDFMGLVKEGTSIASKHGMNDFHMYTIPVGGPATGQVVLSVIFDSMEAYGAFIDKRNADPAWAGMMAKMAGVAKIEQIILLQEIPSGV